MFARIVFVQKCLLVLAAAVVAGSCAPEYPDTDFHREADNDDCINCHVTRSVSVEGAYGPDTPSDHLNGGMPDRRHKRCKECHDMAE